MKLWNKGISLNKQIEEFTVGNDYILDLKLVKYDCLASIAHAKMLGKIGILNDDEVAKLELELNNIIQLNEQGEFQISREQEDCHTAIENYLIEKLGDLGKKIHTARSRNDQVLIALRLYYKEELSECKTLIREFNNSLEKFISQYPHINFPGYTHTRKAMPSSISMWGKAFLDSMADNLKFMDTVFEIIDQSPLGTGAGFGVPLDIDRDFTAKLLEFGKVQENPIYTQNSRGKFESMILQAMSMIMYDFNRISSDLIIFSMPEFGYFELPAEFTTGSSIMPQKKNPDVLELVRSKYHIITSCEFQLKTMMSNLISGYHRDVQLSKEPVMQGIEVTKQCLSIMSLVFSGLKVNEENCKKAMTAEVFATDEAYKLVKQGMTFRDAYRVIGERFK